MKNSCFLRPPDIATLLGVSVARAYQLLADGSIPCVALGGRRLVPREAWDQWLVEQTQRALAGVRAPEDTASSSALSVTAEQVVQHG